MATTIHKATNSNVVTHDDVMIYPLFNVLLTLHLY